jgi:hypothetical protein
MNTVIGMIVCIGIAIFLRSKRGERFSKWFLSLDWEE